jgi:hypothetical protein
MRFGAFQASTANPAIPAGQSAFARRFGSASWDRVWRPAPRREFGDDLLDVEAGGAKALRYCLDDLTIFGVNAQCVFGSEAR